MSESVIVSTRPEIRTGSFYDKIAVLYNLTFKFNGYGRSLDTYFRTHPLPVNAGARILDAGCGTGLLTLALLKALSRPVTITAVDLSASSIDTAKRAVLENTPTPRYVGFSQANVLALPFLSESFDLVVTSGVLEYVPLREGLNELARVLAPGGHLLHLPVKPSLTGRLLGFLFRFKTHSPYEVAENTSRYFRVITNYQFPPLHPIGWSKTAVLAQKL